MAETTAPPRPVEVEPGPGYDEDFVLWARRQATLIRGGRFEIVDWEHVAQEIESLGSGNLRQLGNRLDVLITHLLKWQFQPDARSGNWRGSIRTQRRSHPPTTEAKPELAPTRRNRGAGQLLWEDAGGLLWSAAGGRGATPDHRRREISSSRWQGCSRWRTHPQGRGDDFFRSSS